MMLVNSYLSTLRKEFLKHDPFQVLDQTGVGQLVKMAVEKGRRTRPNIKIGICGEHGGEPSSVEFCNTLGLDYVSCSPFRVPIARLAAAHANIKQGAWDADATKEALKGSAKNIGNAVSTEFDVVEKQAKKVAKKARKEAEKELKNLKSEAKKIINKFEDEIRNLKKK